MLIDFVCAVNVKADKAREEKQIHHVSRSFFARLSFRQCLILTRGANEEVRIWNDQIEDNMQYVVVAMYVCCILTEYNNWTVQK